MSARRVTLVWHGRDVGTIALPDSFRPPLSTFQLGKLSAVPAHAIRSRSWLFEPRPGDFRAEVRRWSTGDGLVVVADDRLGPGDIGCIVGFEPASGCEDFANEYLIALAARIAREARP